MNLFELDRDFLEIENRIIEAGGELTDELEIKYNEVCTALIQKENGYVHVNESFNMQIKAGKDVVKRLQAKIRAMENRQARLKQRLIEHMLTRDIKKIDTELGTVKLTKNNKVADLPVSQYPEKYKTTEIIEKVDKVSLRKDAKTNEDLNKYIEQTYSIRMF